MKYYVRTEIYEHRNDVYPVATMPHQISFPDSADQADSLTHAYGQRTKGDPRGTHYRTLTTVTGQRRVSLITPQERPQ